MCCQESDPCRLFVAVPLEMVVASHLEHTAQIVTHCTEQKQCTTYCLCSGVGRLGTWWLSFDRGACSDIDSSAVDEIDSFGSSCRVDTHREHRWGIVVLIELSHTVASENSNAVRPGCKVSMPRSEKK